MTALVSWRSSPAMSSNSPPQGDDRVSLSGPRAALEGSWLEPQWQTKVEVRFRKHQPDHGGDPHRSKTLPSHGRSECGKDQFQQRCPRQQARPLCVRKHSQNVVPAAHPGPCGYPDLARSLADHISQTSRKIPMEAKKHRQFQQNPPTRSAKKNGV